MTRSDKKQLDANDMLGQKRAQVLADHIRHNINMGQFKIGDRIAPVRKLASLFAMSVMTVREGLALLVEEGILENIGGKKYVASMPDVLAMPSIQNSPENQTTGQVALLMDTQGHFYSQIYAALTKDLVQRQIPFYNVSMQYTQDLSVLEPWLARWATAPPRAVVVSACSSHTEQVIDEACRDRSRIISLYEPTPRGLGWHKVQVDFERMARMAVEHFMSMGHRRIGVVAKRFAHDKEPVRRRSGSMTLALNVGYELRLAQLHRNFTVHFLGREQVSSQDDVDAATRWLNGPSHPTAVVGNDYNLVAIVLAARKLGMVIGRDIDLLGFGNTPWSQAYDFPSMDLQPALFADQLSKLIRMPEADTMGIAAHVKVRPLFQV